MGAEQEVKSCRPSPPGTLTEGTPHRRQGHRAGAPARSTLGWMTAAGPVRRCPMEAHRCSAEPSESEAP